jgi:hypothetical protein
MVRVVLRRPHLWWIALRQFRRMIAPGWWRHRPFLPLPDADYVRYRMETAYGSARAPEPDDVITYLEWCREATAKRPKGSGAWSRPKGREAEHARRIGARRADESPVHFDHRR